MNELNWINWNEGKQWMNWIERKWRIELNWNETKRKEATHSLLSFDSTQLISSLPFNSIQLISLLPFKSLKTLDRDRDRCWLHRWLNFNFRIPFNFYQILLKNNKKMEFAQTRSTYWYRSFVGLLTTTFNSRFTHLGHFQQYYRCKSEVDSSRYLPMEK